MKLVVHFMGLELFRLELTHLEYVEEEEEEEPVDYPVLQQTPPFIETPMVRYDSDDRYRWDEEDRRQVRFGFH